jgi:hypothetical protein
LEPDPRARGEMTKERAETYGEKLGQRNLRVCKKMRRYLLQYAGEMPVVVGSKVVKEAVERKWMSWGERRRERVGGEVARAARSWRPIKPSAFSQQLSASLWLRRTTIHKCGKLIQSHHAIAWWFAVCRQAQPLQCQIQIQYAPLLSIQRSFHCHRRCTQLSKIDDDTLYTAISSSISNITAATRNCCTYQRFMRACLT